MKNYRKKNVQPMRPYIPGEDLTRISVNKEDSPEIGGMIAVNPNNPEDKWYVAKKFFEENYEEALANITQAPQFTDAEVKAVLPKKKQINWAAGRTIQTTGVNYEAGYNQCLSDCRQALLKLGRGNAKDKL